MALRRRCRLVAYYPAVLSKQASSGSASFDPAAMLLCDPPSHKAIAGQEFWRLKRLEVFGGFFLLLFGVHLLFFPSVESRVIKEKSSVEPVIKNNTLLVFNKLPIRPFTVNIHNRGDT